MPPFLKPLGLPDQLSIFNLSPSLSKEELTHSAWELAFKEKTKNATLNGCISKARANSESKLTFSESSLNFLQNSLAPPPTTVCAAASSSRS